MKQPNKSGFTIVELLIVIVVIAILAAISIVAYNGIQNRARVSAASSALGQASKKLSLYAVDNGSAYPATSAAFFTEIGADSSGTKGDVSYQYSVNNSADPKTYCVTATVGNVSYKVAQSGSPSAGGCAGHGSGGVAAVTNVVVNPSAESDGNGWGTANSATVTRQSSSTIFGANGMRVVAPSNNVDSGVGIAVQGTVTAGQNYTASVSVRAITAGIYRLSIQGAGSGPGSGGQNVTFTANQVHRLSVSWTPSSSGTISFYALRAGSVQTGSHTFDVDGAMLLHNSNSVNYADGNSPDWIWNGTPNNSTSTGPAL